MKENLIHYRTCVCNINYHMVWSVKYLIKTLYAAIPRRIDNLSKVLAKRKLDFNDIIADEQELFDVMVNRVRNAHDLDNCSVRPTVLEAFHLDWRDVTEEEQDKVLSMLKGNASQYVKAWRIRNRRTEERFDRFCQQEQLSEGHGIDHLFHGSRTENFWSIVTNGLLINPDCGVQRTGSMFGNGTYFAPLAQKSLGYTDGGYWAGGNTDVRFLAIYRVATGKHLTFIRVVIHRIQKMSFRKNTPERTASGHMEEEPEELLCSMTRSLFMTKRSQP